MEIVEITERDDNFYKDIWSLYDRENTWTQFAKSIGIALDPEAVHQSGVKVLKSPNGKMFASVEDGEYTGGICGSVNPWPIDPKYKMLHVVAWFVIKEKAKTPPGKALLDKLIEWAKTWGAVSVLVSVNFEFASSVGMDNIMVGKYGFKRGDVTYTRKI